MPTQHIYFDEGNGYLFIKHLGRGNDGVASLVRSRHNDTLLVRKEARCLEIPLNTSNRGVYTDTFIEAGVKRKTFQPPFETHIALRLQHIPGVYEAKGWVVHVGESALDVSYWKYYNLGSLWDAHEKATAQGLTHWPEFWACKLLISMVETLTRVHEAGVIHRDTHMSNWLFESHSSTSSNTRNNEIRIILADFGQAEQRQDNTEIVKWLAGCRADYARLVRIISILIGLGPDLATLRAGVRPYCADGNTPCSQAFWDLLAELDSIALGDRLDDTIGDFECTMETWLHEIADHSKTLQPTAWPVYDSPPVNEGSLAPTDATKVVESDLRLLKCWKSAIVLPEAGKSIVLDECPPQWHNVHQRCDFRPRMKFEGGFDDLS